jgi:hypothetical protein
LKVFLTRKKIPSEKIKAGKKLLNSEFDGENWEFHRWNEIIGKVIPKSNAPCLDLMKVPIKMRGKKRHPEIVKKIFNDDQK